MKKQFLLLAFILCSRSGFSQVTECSGIPMSYDTGNALFETAVPASFGDSMITFSITNTHPVQSFAYPLAKLVPVTPLPPGMSLSNNNQPWSVFASSWNPGITMPVHVFYNVTSPIPVNYTVTFELWVSNLLPLPIDSCFFTTTFTINLNPSALSVNEYGNDGNDVIAYPSPANHLLNIKWKNKIGLQKLLVCSIHGEQLMEVNAESSASETQLNVSSLKNGMYLLKIQLTDEVVSVKKFTVIKN